MYPKSITMLLVGIFVHKRSPLKTKSAFQEIKNVFLDVKNLCASQIVLLFSAIYLSIGEGVHFYHYLYL